MNTPCGEQSDGGCVVNTRHALRTSAVVVQARSTDTFPFSVAAGARGTSSLQRHVPYEPSTVERALQLARSGQCRTIGDIKRLLKAEQFAAVDIQLDGEGLKRQLRAAINGARSERPSVQAEGRDAHRYGRVGKRMVAIINPDGDGCRRYSFRNFLRQHGDGS